MIGVGNLIWVIAGKVRGSGHPTHIFSVKSRLINILDHWKGFKLK